MKKLTLIRHAKSDWSDPHLKDFDRPLNNRGHRVAPKMGVKLHEMDFRPDLIISSPAERTKRTVEYLTEQIAYEQVNVRYEEEIYEASVRTLLSEVNHLKDELNHVAIVGHNPSITYLTEYLTGEGVGNVPTCGVVEITFEFEEWMMVSQGSGHLEMCLYPEQLNL